MSRFFVYVQHLLGTGHLRRIEQICNALINLGAAVTLVSGGRGRPGTAREVEVVCLPGIHSDDTFTHLFDDYGNIVGDAFKRQRKQLLLDTFRQQHYDGMVIETFPFGRRQFAFELLPLLEAASSLPHRPLIACSVRDILQPKSNAEKIAETHALIDTCFDLILVHGDKHLIPITRSFPLPDSLLHKVHYTGFIHRREDTAGDMKSDHSSDNCPRILVSAGGGAVGQKIYQTAVAAAKTSHAGETSEKNQELLWHLLIGPNLPRSAFATLARQSHLQDNLIVEHNRTDFLSLLATSPVAVCQAGYNTVLDLIATQTPAVLVPFAKAGEIEQSLRAELMSGIYPFLVIQEEQLSTGRLLEAVSELIDKKQSSASGFSFRPAMNGDLETAKHLLSAVA